MHTGRLLLTCGEPRHAPASTRRIIDHLREIRLIEEPLENQDDAWLLGDSFMQLVTFMGCSPYTALSPGDDGAPFCHLRLDGPHARPRFIQGRNTGAPRCHHCRKRIGDWRERLAPWLQGDETHRAACPHCGERQDPLDYDWRETAGSGRFFILIENIFPQEAIPSPRLMRTLAEADDGLPWRHFYIQE